MFDFLHIKVHRRSYLSYILGLLIVCFVGFFSFSSTLISKSVENYAEEFDDLFSRTEERITKQSDEIDNYLMKLYSNQYLLKDFMNFWGRDAEGYLTERLKDTYYNEKLEYFVSDINEFVEDSNFYIKQVYFKGSESINVMDISDRETMSFRYFIDEKEYQELADDITKGYAYVNTLRTPNNVSKIMGTMTFVLDNQYSFGLIKKEKYDFSAVVSPNGSVYLSNTFGNKINKLIDNIDKTHEIKSSVKICSFEKVYYFMSESNIHNYKMIMAVSNYTIIRENIRAILLILLAVILVFFIAAFIVAFYMQRDAKFLMNIMESIQAAKRGQFESISIGKRTDEYGMIANEFNSMTEELDAYIKREYLLKIKQQETQMEALLYQINPHFLYNTLEIIKSCAMVNKDDKVADALFNLGKMYRNLVKEENIITFEKELDLLSYYLRIMEFKYEASFCYQIDVEDSVKNIETVKFWLQPLVENYFTHGFKKESEFNLLIIQGVELTDRYQIKIIDNGNGEDKERIDEINESLLSHDEVTSNRNIGLKNVNHRLLYFYGDKFSMKLLNNETKGITVEVCIMK